MAVEGSIVWYLRRLAIMSPLEVLHRIREQALRRLSKFSHHRWEHFDIGDGPLMTLGPLRRLSEAHWSDDVATAAANAVASPSVILLGQSWPKGTRIGGVPELWITDPVTKEKWPGSDTFCFDVKWRGRVDKGDIKLVMELNRLQFLQPLCALAIRDHDADAAQRAAEIVLEWMEDNPPYRGINWVSMIELSLRLVSVAFVAAALDATGLDGAHRKVLRRFVAAHAYWLHRFPSLHSSANNHRVAEGLGLLVAADLVPDLPDAPAYRRTGRSILVQAAASQFHDDGVGVEQSPTYAAFTLEMILLGMRLCRDSGEPFPAEVETRVARATIFLRTLLDEAGQAPRIGDDDEGRVIACPPLHEDRYVASVVAASAGVLGRPDLSPPARSAHVRDILFQSPEAPTENATGIFSFEAGGYTVVHEEIAGRRLFAVIDHGPLGLFPLAAHGHADALALWLHVDDQPVIVDAGTYRYHGAQHWRDDLRSTSAHNTLEIEGASQSMIAGPFNWGHKAHARLISLSQGNTWELTAEHDGYKSRFGCIHRRKVTRTDSGLMITDTLEGTARQLDVRISFLIHPALIVDQTGGLTIIKKDHEALLEISASSGEAELVPAGKSEVRNAYSGRYNHIQPATRIIYRPHAIRDPHLVHMNLL